jgi:hypothetical protein
MLKRTLEVIAGLAIVYCLFTYYTDETHPMQLIIWYVISPNVLKAIAWAGLLILSIRLIYGNRASPAGFIARLWNRISAK